MRIKNKIILIYIFFLISSYHLLYFSQPTKLNVLSNMKLDKKIEYINKANYKILDFLNQNYYTQKKNITYINLSKEFIVHKLDRNRLLNELNLGLKNRLSNKKISHHQYSFFLYDFKEYQNYEEYKYNISFAGVENSEEIKSIIEITTNFNNFFINNEKVQNYRNIIEKFKIYQNIISINKINYDEYIFHKERLMNSYYRKYQTEKILIDILNRISQNIYFELNDFSYKYSLHLTSLEYAINILELNELAMKNFIQETQYSNVYSIKKKYFNGYLKYLIIYTFVFVVIGCICKEILTINMLINNLRK